MLPGNGGADAWVRSWFLYWFIGYCKDVEFVAVYRFQINMETEKPTLKPEVGTGNCHQANITCH
jgi:hypothetical protein